MTNLRKYFAELVGTGTQISTVAADCRPQLKEERRADDALIGEQCADRASIGTGWDSHRHSARALSLEWLEDAVGDEQNGDEDDGDDSE